MALAHEQRMESCMWQGEMRREVKSGWEIDLDGQREKFNVGWKKHWTVDELAHTLAALILSRLNGSLPFLLNKRWRESWSY